MANDQLKAKFGKVLDNFSDFIKSAEEKEVNKNEESNKVMGQLNETILDLTAIQQTGLAKQKENDREI